MKSLETSLIPKLNASQVPMPEKDLILESLKSLIEKQKACEEEYQTIEKHKFTEQSKSEKVTKNSDAKFKEKLEKENTKSIKIFTEALSSLSENLSKSLNHMEETRTDVNQIFQKLSSEMDQLSISVVKYFSSLNNLYTNNTPDVKNLKLSELLQLIENSFLKTNSIRRDFKDKLVMSISKLRCLIENLVGQISLIINKYHNCNSEMEEMVNSLSTSTHSVHQFFSNSIINEIKLKTKDLFKKYMHLKEQLNFLKKIINLCKCDTHEIHTSYNILKKLDNSYQKTYKILNKKMRSQSGVEEKNCKKNDNKIFSQPLQSIRENLEKSPEKKIG